jgi:hypothetical protein
LWSLVAVLVEKVVEVPEDLGPELDSPYLLLLAFIQLLLVLVVMGNL